MSGYVGFDPVAVARVVGSFRSGADVADALGRQVASLLDEAVLSDAVSAPAYARADDWRLLAAVLETRIDHAEAFALSADPRVRDLGALQRRLDGWTGGDNDPRLDRLVADRRRAVADLLDTRAIDPTHTRRVLDLLDAGVPAAAALAAVDRVVRIEATAAALALPPAGAAALVDRLDATSEALVDDGFDVVEATGLAALLHLTDGDLTTAQADADRFGLDLATAIAIRPMAEALRLELDEVVALRGLTVHFETLDAARGGDGDLRVSLADLRFVTAHPDRFSPAEVEAARRLLDEPALLTSLDTGATHDDLFEPGRFGATDADDGLISLADVEAFVVRAELAARLAPHLDALDNAGFGDAADGFVSRRDLTAALEDPSFPVEARTAIATALEREWFDRTWWEEHRNSLAVVSAVLAGGAILILTGGLAAPLVVSFTAGFGAAAGTTVLVNTLGGDAERTLDGAFANGVSGGLITMSVVGLGAVSAGTGTGATSGGAGSTAAREAKTVAGHWELGAGIVEASADLSGADDVAAVADTVGTVAGTVGMVASVDIAADHLDDLAWAIAEDGLTPDDWRPAATVGRDLHSLHGDLEALGDAAGPGERAGDPRTPLRRLADPVVDDWFEAG